MDIANAVNDHFINAAKCKGEIHKDNAVNTNTQQIQSSIFLRPTCAEEIVTSLMKLKSNAAAGIDEISAEPVLYIAPLISDVLSYIIILTLTSGIYPKELKVAKVVPVYKGGTQDDLSNSRPISVLPVFSKIFEDVI